MKRKATNLLLIMVSTAIVSFASTVLAENHYDIVSADGDFTLEADELSYLIANAPTKLKEALKTTPEDRFEFIAQIITSKRLASEAQKLSREMESDDYWNLQFDLLAAYRKFMVERLQRDMDIPDFTALAQERYQVNKQEIAFAPESRRVAHILRSCTDDCDEAAIQQELRDRAKQITNAQEFYLVAQQISDDTASAQSGGKLELVITQGNKNIAEEFVTASFALEEVGDVSPVINTDFGYHLIMLESVEEEHIKPFDEVKDKLMRQVEREFRVGKQRAYLEAMGPSDQLVIYEELFDEIVGVSKTSDVVTQEVE